MDKSSTSSTTTTKETTVLPLFQDTPQRGHKCSWWRTGLCLALAVSALLAGLHHHHAHHPAASSTDPPTSRRLASRAAYTIKSTELGFVKRVGDKLMLADEEFRWNSWNVPDLHIVEDDQWHPVDPFEQEDALHTISRMGGQVVRIYPLSIAGGFNNGTYTHLLGPAEYNEPLFRDMDTMLALANKYGVRTIIPFIDNWEWWGGIHQFCSFFGENFREFYRNDNVKLGFKAYVRHILLRTNTITGVQYKDDPAILAWETGNELDYDDQGINSGLPSTAEMDAWTMDLAAYVKSLDANHLVIDGRQLRNRDISPAILEDPNVDIITDHFYPNLPVNFNDRLDNMLSFTKGKKPFLVGEFGLVPPETMESLLVQMVASSGVCGGLIWSLRSHSRFGGFYWHYEYDVFWAYHYPGFDTNETKGEKAVVKMMTKYAYAMQQREVPPEAPPTQPSIITTSTTNNIAWRGSVGAQSYVLQRAAVPIASEEVGAADKGQQLPQTPENMQWTTVASGLSDSAHPYVPFADTTAEPGMTYYYRIYAVNDAGQSQPSTAIQLPGQL